METAHDELAKFGIPLASNEVQINLLHRKIETNGMLDAARRLGVSLLAYSSQRQGILTGKYHADRSLIEGVHPLRRKVMGLNPQGLDRTQPLIDAMHDIAATHQATVGQVALAWLVGYYDDTVFPIAGASKPHPRPRGRRCAESPPISRRVGAALRGIEEGHGLVGVAGA